MSATYTTIGTALFDLFSGIDITAIYPGGWAIKANYPLKEPARLTTWPVFAVVPIEDNETELDSRTDDDSVIYEVYLFDTFEDSATTEGRMRQLVDLCRARLRLERIRPTILESSVYSIDSMTGAWGFEINDGLRYYRFRLTVKKDQDLF